MKLYYVVGSPNCRKVLAVAKHLGVALEIEYLDFFAGDLARAEFLEVNPNAMVPALTDGDLRLFESNAITQYLADTAGSDELFPRDARGRADVSRWQFWELAHFNRAFGRIAFETVAKPTFGLGETDHGLVRAEQRDLARYAKVLDAHLAKRRFLVRDRITLADYAVISCETFKEAMPFDWTPYRHLNAYFERMRQVPHWIATAPPSREATGRRPRAA